MHRCVAVCGLANYEKKRRKVGRPPGGHSNLELAAKRSGRRKRHRRIVLTLRKKHGVTGALLIPELSVDSVGLGRGSEMAERRKKVIRIYCICNFVSSEYQQANSSCSLVQYSYGKPIVFRCMGVQLGMGSVGYWVHKFS